VYGTHYLDRASAREALQAASAYRAAQSPKDDYQDWRRDMDEAAGG
jgi:hypothetical protein